jgi:hypothetical protein
VQQLQCTPSLLEVGAAALQGFLRLQYSTPASMGQDNSIWVVIQMQGSLQ